MSEFVGGLHIDPQAWIAGVKDAYAGLHPRPDSDAGDARSYASGRVEGEALRLRHRREYEQLPVLWSPDSVDSAVRAAP